MMTTLNYEAGTFPTADGLRLYYQRWRPGAGLRCNVILVHGLGGHSGLFSRLVELLLPRGYGFYALDLRGHGRSPGPRGHIQAWTNFRDDLGGLMNEMMRQCPASPYVLLGHSLGATIVLDYALHCAPSARGIVAMAPAVGQVGVSPLRLGLARLLSRIWPTLTLQTGVDPDVGSRDPAVNAAFAEDPLGHTQGSVRLATEFLAAVQRLRDQVSALRTPLLILQGGADRATPAAATRDFFQRARLQDKELREYPEAYHELHRDINYREVIADLGDWLDRHARPPAGCPETRWSRPPADP